MKKHYLRAALLAVCPLAANAQDAVPAAPAAPAVVTSVPGTASAVTLRLKFTPGKTTYYTLTTDTDGTMQMPQGAMPLKNHITMTLHQTVKDVRASDGAATIETGIDSMTMSMNGQPMPMPPDKAAQMKALGTLLILPTGKTLSFTPNPDLGAPAMPGMDMSKINAMGSLGQFPDAPVKPGDAWKTAVSMGMLGAQVASDFTLSSVDTTGASPIAVITQVTKGKFDLPSADGAAPAAMGGMKMAGDVNGTGTLRFDTTAGAVDSQTSKADITMNMTLPNATEPMELQMKIRSTMKRAPAPAGASDAAVQ